MSNEITLEPEEAVVEDAGGEPQPRRGRLTRLSATFRAKAGAIMPASRIVRTAAKIGAATAGLLIVAAGGYVVYTFIGTTKAPSEVAVAYVEVPDLLVNMRTADGRPRFLKVKVVLEVPEKEAVARLRTKMPLLIDGFQGLLREMRPEDLNGASGTFRIKEELLARSVQVAYPDVVSDVLIQELVQQ